MSKTKEDKNHVSTYTNSEDSTGNAVIEKAKKKSSTVEYSTVLYITVEQNSTISSTVQWKIFAVFQFRTVHYKMIFYKIYPAISIILYDCALVQTLTFLGKSIEWTYLRTNLFGTWKKFHYNNISFSTNNFYHSFTIL